MPPAKAETVFREHPDSTVIGADTLVFLEGFPLGKPEDEEEARSMLRKLSGRTHHVCTAVAIRSPLGMKNLAVLTEVTFRKLTEKDIRHYMELVDVMDKAGSYAFQEHGEMIISSVRGDTDNVIDCLSGCDEMPERPGTGFDPSRNPDIVSGRKGVSRPETAFGAQGKAPGFRNRGLPVCQE